MVKRRAKDQGSQKYRYPVDPARFARVCRQLARDIRAEDAAGWGPLPVTGTGTCVRTIPRAEAAASLDAQAERWEEECRTGVRNEYDRERIGMP